MSARINLSEVVSALSRALDLTDGQPLGHTMRSCVIGMRLGREMGVRGEDTSALYYALLLKDAGCSSNAARICQLFGTDDITVKPRMRDVDRQSLVRLAVRTARTVALGGSASEKLSRLLGIARTDDMMSEVLQLRCERGADIAGRLGFPRPTIEAIKHLDEHWNGRGHPEGLAGPAIPIMARIASLAQVVEAYHRRGGVRAAVRVARDRRGKWFDPVMADHVVAWRHEEDWWARLDDADVKTIVGEEPAEHVRSVSEDDIDVVARAFADIIDAKSPYTSSHSRNVASYSLGIAREMGLGTDIQRRVYRAGLLHDIGKLGVSNSILDKPGQLTRNERDAVERHPFLTWEILSAVPAFKDFAWSASLHHERLDGSGYPWHVSGDRIDMVARVLCVADVYEALTADRPYRSGMTWAESSRILWNGRGSEFDPTVLDALASCRKSTADMTRIAPIAA